MGRGTRGEVWDRSGDHRRGTGRVEGHLGRFGMGRGPSRRSGTDHGTLEEVRDGLGALGEVRDGSGDPREGAG